MPMKLKKLREGNPPIELNLTSMIDVIFLLLIFFVFFFWEKFTCLS